MLRQLANYNVKMTGEERCEIQRQAAAAGMSASDYGRVKFGLKPHDLPHGDFVPRYKIKANAQAPQKQST